MRSVRAVDTRLSDVVGNLKALCRRFGYRWCARACVLLALSGVGSPAARADVVVLRNGNRLYGIVRPKGDQGIVIHIGPRAAVTLSMSEIVEIIREPVRRPPPRREIGPESAPAEVEAETEPVGPPAREQGATETSTPPALPQPDPVLLARVEALLDQLKKEPPAPAGQVTRELVRMGPSVVPCLVAAFEGASESAQEAITAALAQSKDETVFPYLTRLVAESQDAAMKTVALRLYGRLGEPKALVTLVSLMDEIQPEIRRQGGASVELILERYPTEETYYTLERLIRRTQGETKACLIEAISRAGSPYGLELLVDLLGRDQALDPVIISRVVASAQAGYPDELLPKLQDLLYRDDPALRREAALALGRLRDFPSTVYLVDLLSDENRGVRENALWALRNISGLNFPADPDRWSQWFEHTLAEQERRQRPGTTADTPTG